MEEVLQHLPVLVAERAVSIIFESLYCSKCVGRLSLSKGLQKQHEDSIFQFLATVPTRHCTMIAKSSDQFHCLYEGITLVTNQPNFKGVSITFLDITFSRDEYREPGHGQEIVTILPFIPNLQCLWVHTATGQTQSKINPAKPSALHGNIVLQHLKEIVLNGDPDVIEVLGFIQHGSSIKILDINPAYQCQERSWACVTKYLNQYLASNAINNLTSLAYTHCCGKNILDVHLLPAIQELGLMGIKDIKKIVALIQNDDLVPHMKTIQVSRVLGQFGRSL
ncbi:hypothetical protein M408DRAFT_28746 [Serendipita vermifera MAFF 305830]|uniref:Uncharacterized protein n=1 Tax=Serendipita vermifera MAFF 305830 TaxID=933852 RepID=A0A0C2WYF4_SERVB|nr:hypothetical protein M408DRAFT_28746 [Serendipita vermifera MAFF 305830]